MDIKPTTHPLTPQQIDLWLDIYDNLRRVRDLGTNKNVMMVMTDGMLLHIGGVQVAYEQGFMAWVDVPHLGEGKVVLTPMGEDTVLDFSPFSQIGRGLPPWDGENDHALP